MARKIPSEHENPIDDVIIELADRTDDIYRYYDMTPNNITTISLFCGILTAYLIYIDQYALATLTYLLSYYYDCMDGNYARKYNMVSEYGDYYDHFNDTFRHALIIAVMYSKDREKAIFVLIILVIFTLLCAVHLGCQEKLSKSKKKQPLLDMTKLLCPYPNMINYTKYVGCGTAAIVMAIMILTFPYGMPSLTG